MKQRIESRCSHEVLSYHNGYVNMATRVTQSSAPRSQ